MAVNLESEDANAGNLMDIGTYRACSLLEIPRIPTVG